MRRGDGECCVGVDGSHEGRFLVPVLRGVLDDAEGVNPKVLVAETGGEGYRIEEKRGESTEGDVMQVATDVGLGCLQRGCQTPAVAQGEVLARFSSFGET